MKEDTNMTETDIESNSQTTNVVESPLTAILKDTKKATIHKGRVDMFELDLDNNRTIQKKLVEEYARTIAITGVDKPLLVRLNKETGKYLVIDGNHRVLAAQKVVADGGDPGYIKYEIDNTINDEQRDILQIRRNTNANLLPIDEANIFSRLVSKGYKQTEIAQLTGRTQSHISQMMALSRAPKTLQNHLADERISSTLLIGLYKQYDGNWDTITKLCDDLLQHKEQKKVSGDSAESKKADKVTEKDVIEAGLSKKESRTIKRISKMIETVKNDEQYDKNAITLLKNFQKAVTLAETDTDKALKFIMSKFGIV